MIIPTSQISNCVMSRSAHFFSQFIQSLGGQHMCCRAQHGLGFLDCPGAVAVYNGSSEYSEWSFLYSHTENKFEVLTLIQEAERSH